MMTEQENELPNPGIAAASAAAKPRKTTRAPACAGEAPPPIEVTAVAVRVPPGSLERRTPVAEVDVRIGPVTVTFLISSLQGNRLVARAPMKAGSADPGIGLPPKVAEAVSAVVMEAAKTHPEAGYVLRRMTPPSWRAGRAG